MMQAMTDEHPATDSFAVPDAPGGVTVQALRCWQLRDRWWAARIGARSTRADRSPQHDDSQWTPILTGRAVVYFIGWITTPIWRTDHAMIRIRPVPSPAQLGFIAVVALVTEVAGLLTALLLGLKLWQAILIALILVVLPGTRMADAWMVWHRAIRFRHTIDWYSSDLGRHCHAPTGTGAALLQHVHQWCDERDLTIGGDAENDKLVTWYLTQGRHLDSSPQSSRRTVRHPQQ